MYTRVARPFLDFSEGGLGTRLSGHVYKSPVFGSCTLLHAYTVLVASSVVATCYTVS